MTQKNKTGRFHRLSAWAMTICVTAVFAVFTLNSTAGAASAQNADAALQRFGVRGNVACSTYGNNPNGFMANVLPALRTRMRFLKIWTRKTAKRKDFSSRSS